MPPGGLRYEHDKRSAWKSRCPLKFDMRHFVGPDLAPNCLHRLSADDISRNRDPENLIILFVYQVQMMEFHGSYKSIGTEMNRDVTVIWSL